jgi:hypothetical protein
MPVSFTDASAVCRATTLRQVWSLDARLSNPQASSNTAHSDLTASAQAGNKRAQKSNRRPDMSLATTARVSARPPGIPTKEPRSCPHANATAVGCRQQCCFVWKAAVSETARSFPGGVSGESSRPCGRWDQRGRRVSPIKRFDPAAIPAPRRPMQAVKRRKVGRATRRVLPIFSAFAWQLIQRG